MVTIIIIINIITEIYIWILELGLVVGWQSDVTGRSGWEIRRVELTSPGCWLSDVAAVAAVAAAAAGAAVGGWLGAGRRISACSCRVPAPIGPAPAAVAAFRPGCGQVSR